MMVSESVALRQQGYKRSDIQDILPRQAVIIPKYSPPVIAQVQPRKACKPDIIEYCYFARLDAILTSSLSLKLFQADGYGHVSVRRTERIIHDLGFL